MRKSVLGLLITSILLISHSSNAQAPVVKESKEFLQFVEKLKQQAKEQGISDQIINEAFTNVYFLDRVVNADKNQLEKKITLDQYLTRVLSTEKRQESKDTLIKYNDKLSAISALYGVQKSYIIALWGLESSFGRIQGKENVISALATLAFDGRREAFFSKELMVALQILEKGYASADQLKGSWAGAMGQPQFMPTSLLKYGADGDGDGIIDIWNNVDDVFASIANYLSTEGWQSDLRWGNEVMIPIKLNSTLAGLDDIKAKPISEWLKLGVKFDGAHKHPELTQRAWLILPDDNDERRAFLVYDNFRTIMHWNRSYYFAISVGMLADSMTSVK